MTLKEQIMKLQTYKMYGGEDTVYVERDDVLKLLEQQTCEDAISRAEAINIVNDMLMGEANHKIKALEQIQDLPSVKPQRAKGHWLGVDGVYGVVYCQCCNYELHTNNTNFCPNCGASMVESEDEK